MTKTYSQEDIALQQSANFMAARAAKQRQKTIDLIKKGIWLYFWLVIFEGALRKWFLPFLATPLLIVRDPVALWLLFMAHSKGLFKITPVITAVWVITGLSFLFSLTVGHGNFGVALYGARIPALHFPLVFLIQQVFNKEDVESIGKGMLWATIIQTVVMGLQFYSPQSAWINKGIGGEEVVGFTGGLGFSRPPGTFSFTNGLSLFYGLAAPFIFYLWLDNKVKVQKWLLIAATCGLLVAIPLSISRSLLLSVAISAAFAVAIAARKPKILGRLIIAVVGIGILFSILGKASFFQTGIAAFTDRFETASDTQESGATTAATERVTGGIFEIFRTLDQVPFLGLGLGIGTNVGAKLLTGKQVFLIAESEWGRVAGEMGLIFGLLFLLIRANIAFGDITKSFRALGKGNYLPWLLASFTFLNMLEGQWSQPTSLGIAVFASGLCLASLKVGKPATKAVKVK